MLSCFSHVQLFAALWMVAPGSSVHGILQARIPEWVAIPSPGDLPDPGIEPTPLMPSALAGRFVTTSATWDVEMFLVDVCPTQCYKG